MTGYVRPENYVTGFAKGRPPVVDEETRRARRAERERRRNRARGMAMQELARVHHEEFKHLADIYLELIYEEKGTLPGDKETS